ncbi:zinc/iron-chelating domain-containing protein [Desulfosarcina ovata subsp. sediminis]|uniref:Zinc/iron-chelating domain-containing protein n=1 Tax=Desulfosarcina ovata subsp. sediminis TaxID=885957 RepID=A0A5K7ZVH0_9BACT|nr:YkgJ family cysteine cluster protein [Desulfosarcina ovata]BBO84229.1 zinc/iron-chelating domain-containing protein [Desulfosarcina ovata subsp. sediminis]
MRDPVFPLSKHQTFRFRCSPEVACFNACCRDLQQVLTPYDILCLKQYTEMSSSEFLKRYTEASTGPGTGLPVVSLRFADAADLACPFVSDAGCRVYPARPASCRTYPLARGVSYNRETGKRVEHWALIREPHCRGFDSGPEQTIDRWVEGQQIAEHNRMNDRMLSLISDKNRFRPGPLKPSESQLVYTALYDLDVFRETLFTTGKPVKNLGGIKNMDQARSDDSALLTVAMAWVRENVFTLSQENDAR